MKQKFWLILTVMFLISLSSVLAANPVAVAGTNTTNATELGEVALLSQKWTGNNLTGYIQSVQFTGGSWSNGSYVVMTGASNWSNATHTISSTQGVTSWRYYANDTQGNITASPISYINTYASFNETYSTGTCPVTDTPSALIFILIGILLVAMAVIGKTWATMPIWNMLVGLAMAFYSFPLYGCMFIFGGIITVFGIMIALEAVIAWRTG